MSRPRKTMDVETIRIRVNEALRTFEHENQEYAKGWRSGVAITLSYILLATDNYKGFRYLDEPYEAGVTDESRVEYY